MAITWKAGRHGSGAYAHLTADLDMGVSYEASARLDPDAPHYNVSVFGERLPDRAVSLEAGKVLAIDTAKKWLREALAQLES